MSQGQKSSAATVFLLEDDPSMRRLITLGLRHRGLQVIEATSLSTISSSDLQALDLLILDVDRGVACDWTMLETVQEHPQLAFLPTVVLSWESPVQEAVAQAPFCLTKPFDARALHAGVDQLLVARTVAQTEKLAQAEAVLLAAYYKNSAAPSIWPVITAAGLFVAVIGLLLQFALTLIGFAIIVIGLLLWTIGSRSQIDAPELAFGIGK